MAFERTDLHWPEQWRRLTEGDEKSPPWGKPQPEAAKMNGKVAEELRNWAANCTNKISYYLGKVPDGDTNDGFWEVRMYWHSERKKFLLEAATRLQLDAADHHHRYMQDTTSLPAIRPLFPFQARPVSYTKRGREEEMAAGKKEIPGSNPQDGTGQMSLPVENVATVFPSAACIPPASGASLIPSKPPKKRRKKEFELLKDASQERGEDDEEEIDPLLYCDEELSDSENEELTMKK